ncbi:uncharacterized protein LOC116165694 isoform X2 [Photinus pyralis]|nr:uncharacterized protein LOC116165694 isoform X2 [Photinus pyralis]
MIRNNAASQTNLSASGFFVMPLTVMNNSASIQMTLSHSGIFVMPLTVVNNNAAIETNLPPSGMLVTENGYVEYDVADEPMDVEISSPLKIMPTTVMNNNATIKTNLSPSEIFVMPATVMNKKAGIQTNLSSSEMHVTKNTFDGYVECDVAEELMEVDNSSPSTIMPTTVMNNNVAILTNYLPSELFVMPPTVVL